MQKATSSQGGSWGTRRSAASRREEGLAAPLLPEAEPLTGAGEGAHAGTRIHGSSVASSTRWRTTRPATRRDAEGDRAARLVAAAAAAANVMAGAGDEAAAGAARKGAAAGAAAAAKVVCAGCTDAAAEAAGGTLVTACANCCTAGAGGCAGAAADEWPPTAGEGAVH